MSYFKQHCRAGFLTADILLFCLSVGVATGQVFAPNVQVDDGEPFAQYRPCIALGLNRELYVLFGDKRDGGQMYFARSLNGGRTWSRPNIRVSDDCINDASTPSCLAVDCQGTIYACWTDERGLQSIYCSKSTDKGDTWSRNVRVGDPSPTGKMLGSMVVAPDQSICVVWTDYRTGCDIYFARSTDGGETWTDPNIRVDDGSSGTQSRPCICADQWGTLYVGYESNQNSERGYHVYLVRSTDYGETWSAPAFRIDDGQPPAFSSVSLQVSTTGLYAVWAINTYMDNVVFAKSTDRGETWSRPVGTVDHIGEGIWSEDIDLAIGEDGTLYATWMRWEVHGDGQADIYFGQSTDDGQTWTNPSVQVSDVWLDTQENPELTIDRGQGVCITWVDARERTPTDPVGVYFTRTVPVLAYGETDESEVPRGGELGVAITLINCTGVERVADAWTEVVLPSGKPYRGNPVLGPQTVTLASYDTLCKHVSHPVSHQAPLGDYLYRVKAGKEYPYFLFKDTFTFTVVEE